VPPRGALIELMAGGDFGNVALRADTRRTQMRRDNAARECGAQPQSRGDLLAFATPARNYPPAFGSRDSSDPG